MSVEPSGTLRIGVTASFDRDHLSGLISSYLERFPQMSVSVTLAGLLQPPATKAVVSYGINQVVRLLRRIFGHRRCARAASEQKDNYCSAPFPLCIKYTLRLPMGVIVSELPVEQQTLNQRICHLTATATEAPLISGPLFRKRAQAKEICRVGIRLTEPSLVHRGELR